MRQRLREIQDRIDRAAESVGRDPASVTLIAVSKTVSVEAIREAYDLGMRNFGESRLQEASPKIDALPYDIVWHFIGTLQSNKAKVIAERFAVVQTLATETAAKELNRAAQPIATLIEVNVANEPQKAGISAKDLDVFVQTLIHYTQVHLRGLMTIGPALEPEAMRPYFREMREMQKRLNLPILSMGMSSDFDVAVKEGATHVRVGSALFGARP